MALTDSSAHDITVRIEPVPPVEPVPTEARVRSAAGLVGGAEKFLRLAVMLAILGTAVESVIVPRGLYADGSWSLWAILTTKNFVFVNPARLFTQLLNEAPVVLAVKLGVRNLDALIAVHSVGVAAVPILCWVLALGLQFRDRLFWPLAAIYATAFLTSGFVAVGEYTFAFGLTAVVLSILCSSRTIGRWRIACLVVASTALVLSYEGMCFLALPWLAVGVIRMFKRSWLVVEPPSRAERRALWYSALCAVASGVVAVGVILLRMQNAADSNLAGAMNVDFALENNKQWRVSALVAVLFIASRAIRWWWLAAVVQIAAAVLSVRLLEEAFWTPAWLHYNSRSLSCYSFAALFVLAVAVQLLRTRRGPGAGASPSPRTPRLTREASRLVLAVGMALFVGAASLGFVTTTHRYGLWLDSLQQHVEQGHGLMEILPTGLYTGKPSQFSWGWTNPYTSVLLQSRPGQGIVLSHVETLAHHSANMLPKPLALFQAGYHR